MLVGVISDTHDNLPAIRAALDVFARRGAGAVLHAGDFVSPFALKMFLNLDAPFFGVLGNNDGEREGLRALCPALKEGPYRFELGDRIAVMAHKESDLDGDVVRGADLCIFGHSHRPDIRAGRPLAVNPGECGGWLSGRRTVALVDLAAMEGEIVDIGLQETVQP